jgi:hypothetical protein
MSECCVAGLRKARDAKGLQLKYFTQVFAKITTEIAEIDVSERTIFVTIADILVP